MIPKMFVIDWMGIGDSCIQMALQQLKKTSVHLYGLYCMAGSACRGLMVVCAVCDPVLRLAPVLLTARVLLVLSRWWLLPLGFLVDDSCKHAYPCADTPGARGCLGR